MLIHQNNVLDAVLDRPAQELVAAIFCRPHLDAAQLKAIKAPKKTDAMMIRALIVAPKRRRRKKSGQRSLLPRKKE